MLLTKRGVQALGLMTWFAAIVATGGAAAADLQKIKIGIYAGTTLSLHTMVASSEGFAEKEGLELELIAIPSGPQHVSALMSGQVDVAQAIGTVVYPAITRGEMDTVVLGAGRFDTQTLIASPQASITHRGQPYPAAVGDLKGKTIGVVARGGFLETYVATMLGDAGLDPSKDVTWVSTGSTANNLAAFKARQVDAVIVQPQDVILGFDSPEEYVPVTSAIDGTDGGILKFNIAAPAMASREWHDGNPELVKKLCRALGAAADWLARPNNPDAVTAAAKWLEMDEAKAKELLQVEASRYDFRMPQDAWEGQFVLLKDTPVLPYDRTVSSVCQTAIQ